MAAQGMEYHNFELEIRAVNRRSGSYQARVLYSPLGQAETNFHLRQALKIYHDKLQLIGGAIRAYQFGTPDDDQSVQLLDPKSFGQDLFKTVFADPISTSLRRSLDAARRDERGLRIRLRLNNVPELAELPWEYLFDADENHFLVLSKYTPIVRYLEKAASEQPLRIDLPLRILVMIADAEDVVPRLKVEQERERVQEALSSLQHQKLVKVDWLRQAAAPELLRRLREGQYHIFHFVGHGWFDETNAANGLVLANQGRGGKVAKDRLGVVLRDVASLRLVFLNACESARAIHGQPFGGVAQHLVQQGVPAVVAMQFPVTDDSAIIFAEEFYRSLADGDSVDTALTEARKIIYANGSAMEWGIPVLFSRSSDNRLFDLPKRAATLRNVEIANSLSKIMESEDSWSFGRYGLDEDPFGYLNAEQLVGHLDILQDTFIPYSISYEQIMDFTRSSVLMASPGSGKTMGRLWLEEKLKENRQATLRGSHAPVSFPQMPFVVRYDDFDQLGEMIPRVNLSHHRESFLQALAESIALFEEECVQLGLRGHMAHLNSAKEFIGSLIQNPGQGPTSLSRMIRKLFQYLQPLQFNAIVILVDNLDIHITDESTPNVEHLIKPLLNSTPLFDPPIFWKVFVSSDIKNMVISSAAYRRLRLRFVPLEWDKVSLSRVLKQRLRWASGGTISDGMNQLCDTSLLNAVKDLDVELAQLALRDQTFGPPRTLLKLAQALLREPSETGSPISLKDWERFKAQLDGSKSGTRNA